MTDHIIKTAQLAAPIEKVWRAISDPTEFGAWFRVELDGPFTVGETTTGRMTYPGHEGEPWLSTTTRLEPPHHLAFTWPHPTEGQIDLNEAPRTLVEFQLQAIPGGTQLTITESGFDALPKDQRVTAMRNNEGGWNIQARHLAAHVES
jgi:uncharacterized protein YndB with AHSA1/START domain